MSAPRGWSILRKSSAMQSKNPQQNQAQHAHAPRKKPRTLKKCSHETARSLQYCTRARMCHLIWDPCPCEQILCVDSERSIIGNGVIESSTNLATCTVPPSLHLGSPTSRRAPKRAHLKHGTLAINITRGISTPCLQSSIYTFRCSTAQCRCAPFLPSFFFCSNCHDLSVLAFSLSLHYHFYQHFSVVVCLKVRAFLCRVLRLMFSHVRVFMSAFSCHLMFYHVLLVTSLSGSLLFLNKLMSFCVPFPSPCFIVMMFSVSCLFHLVVFSLSSVSPFPLTAPLTVLHTFNFICVLQAWVMFGCVIARSVFPHFVYLWMPGSL